jgi:hypothetical protein
MAHGPIPDVEASISFLPTAAGGRATPARSGYRPQHQIRPDYQTSGTHRYVDCEEVAPGEIALATITFITPEAYPNSIRAGDVLDVLEGSRLVGHATIRRVLNASLERAGTPAPEQSGGSLTLTRAELLELIRQHGVPDWAYAFGAPTPENRDGVIAIEREGLGWLVCYYERGSPKRMDTVASEERANALLWRSLRLEFAREDVP